MRGMQRLAAVTESVFTEMDKEADAAADEVLKARDYAKGAVDKFRDQARQIRRSADDVLAQLGQISNMAPSADPGDAVAGTASSLPQPQI